MKTLTGGNDGEVPPVPIPNTEVKLSSAESTWLDTAREDRSLPVPLKESHLRLFFLCFGGGLRRLSARNVAKILSHHRHDRD